MLAVQNTGNALRYIQDQTVIVLATTVELVGRYDTIGGSIDGDNLVERLHAHEDLVRDGDKDRFLATLFAPAGRRDALYALYAFNLEIVRIAESDLRAFLAVHREA